MPKKLKKPIFISLVATTISPIAPFRLGSVIFNILKNLWRAGWGSNPLMSEIKSLPLDQISYRPNPLEILASPRAPRNTRGCDENGSLVVPPGFEPGTLCFVNRRSVQVSYGTGMLSTKTSSVSNLGSDGVPDRTRTCICIQLAQSGFGGRRHTGTVSEGRRPGSPRAGSARKSPPGVARRAVAAQDW